jgi:hypothetical protein
VICNSAIPLLVNIVGDNEEKIKTRKKGIGQCDILMGIFMDIILNGVRLQNLSKRHVV